MRQIVIILAPILVLVSLLVFVYGLYGTGIYAVKCRIGSCPTTLTEEDSYKTLLYRVEGPFTVQLFERINPSERLVCEPKGVIELLGIVPLDEQRYEARYRGANHGACELRNNNFVANIIIRETGR